MFQFGDPLARLVTLVGGSLQHLAVVRDDAVGVFDLVMQGIVRRLARFQRSAVDLADGTLRTQRGFQTFRLGPGLQERPQQLVVFGFQLGDLRGRLVVIRRPLLNRLFVQVLPVQVERVFAVSSFALQSELVGQEHNFLLETFRACAGH